MPLFMGVGQNNIKRNMKEKEATKAEYQWPTTHKNTHMH